MIKVIIDDVEFALDNQKPMSIHTMKIEKIGKKVIIDGVEYVPKVEEIEAEEWPQVGDKVWWLEGDNTLSMETYGYDDNEPFCRALKRGNNAFKSMQKAEYERLRRECMATRWVPGKEDYYCLMIIDNNSRASLIKGGGTWACAAEVILGLAAPNDQEAQARWDKYGEAWLDVLKT